MRTLAAALTARAAPLLAAVIAVQLCVGLTANIARADFGLQAGCMSYLAAEATKGKAMPMAERTRRCGCYSRAVASNTKIPVDRKPYLARLTRSGALRRVPAKHSDASIRFAQRALFVCRVAVRP